MKKVNLCLIILSAAILGVQGISYAAIISFVDPLQGIDDTAGWATTISDTPNQLGHSYSLLGGLASVSAYKLIPGPEDVNGDLSHRLGRGIGVWGGEDDEINRSEVDNREFIDVTFNVDSYINSIEVSSLFIEGDPSYAEKGRVWFYLNGSEFVWNDLLGTADPNGIRQITFSTPYLVDWIRFGIPDGSVMTLSEFAVAKLDVTPVNPVPEPASLSLLGLGLLGLIGFRKRKV